MLALSDGFRIRRTRGDGRLDRVSVKPIAGNSYEQSLVATVGRVAYATRVPVDPSFGVQPLRVTDVNDDGRQEVVVTESVGANIFSFTVWGLFGGLRPTTTRASVPPTPSTATASLSPRRPPP